MKYIKLLVVIIIVAAVGWLGFNYFKSEETQQKPKIIRNLPLKEVEVFNLSEDEAQLVINKSGKSSADITAYISPQISGKVTNINVQIGDSVNKDDILIELGESLSTDTIDTQYSSAIYSAEIAVESQKATKASGEIAIKSSELAAHNALMAYNNAVEVKNTTQDLLQLQINSSELNLEAIEDQIEDLEEDLDDLEDELEDIEDSAAKQQLERQIEQLEQSIETLEIQEDQAELALKQAKESYKLQVQQLNSSIRSAKVQCEIALRQVESAKAAKILQELQAKGQVIQAETSRLIAELQFNEKNIKAPISGLVTSISIEEGNLVTPGQIIIQVEKTDNISIKTSLNENEVAFVEVGDEVEIEIDGQIVTGKIISISPSLNSQSKKIDVEIEISNQSIKAGAFAKVQFKANQGNRVFIPLNSIHLSESDKFVWVLDENNQTSLQAIETGEIIGEFIEVKNGLEGNEKIIRTSSSFLTEGEKVEIASK